MKLQLRQLQVENAARQKSLDDGTGSSSHGALAVLTPAKKAAVPYVLSDLKQRFFSVNEIIKAVLSEVNCR